MIYVRESVFYELMDLNNVKEMSVKQRVDAAEKEASEVLHSLLSVERIEKQDAENTKILDNNELNVGDKKMQWNGAVTISTQPIFSLEGNANFQQAISDQKVVIWEGNTIDIEPDATEQDLNIVYPSINATNDDQLQPLAEKTKSKLLTEENLLLVDTKKKKKKRVNVDFEDCTKIEENAAQVKERFKRGCDCQDESCFRGLNPESVYRHRLNIAELTKAEHDMYLMGVTMACLANPDTTVRHKERKRLRAQYVYQGRRVCLDAFLYLENCTHYQLKCIRKHVTTHGVAPRVHGNHGKKPHNTFSLDIYRHATSFLKQYLEQHTGEGNSKQAVQLPWDVTRKHLHEAYQEYAHILEPDTKLMGYSTFRQFMKEQFPNVKFCKIEPKTTAPSNNNISTTSNQAQQPAQQFIEITEPLHVTASLKDDDSTANVQSQSTTSVPLHQMIPVVVDNSVAAGTAQFIVTPMTQILQNGNLVTPANSTAQSNTTYSYQLANTGYVINEQGNIVTAASMTANAQPYAFNRIA